MTIRLLQRGRRSHTQRRARWPLPASGDGDPSDPESLNWADHRETNTRSCLNQRETSAQHVADYRGLPRELFHLGKNKRAIVLAARLLGRWRVGSASFTWWILLMKNTLAKSREKKDCLEMQQSLVAPHRASTSSFLCCRPGGGWWGVGQAIAAVLSYG